MTSDRSPPQRPPPPHVLFVCVGNSCRSQMAEAFARHHGLTAASAGTQPAAAVSRNAVAAMAEKGIPMDQQHPKTLNLKTLKEYDRVITMGCGVSESCPTLNTDEDWGLDDPVGKDLDAFRACRDQIEARVKRLAEELLADPAP